MSNVIHTGAMVTVQEGPFALLCRGLARVVSAGVLALTVVFAVHEGVPNPFLVTARENFTMAAYVLMVLGLYAGFRWERVATALVLPLFTVFTLLNYPVTQGFWMGWFYLSFPLAAMLFWFGRRRQPDRRGV